MPEVRLIDANALHAKIMKDNDNDLSRKENIAQFLLRIETEPTIEAEPIRHGEWIPVSSYEAFGGVAELWGDSIAYYYCSKCKEQAYADEFGRDILSKFCPHCGAKMQYGCAENG